MIPVETHNFSNGLRLVLERLPGSRSAAIAVGFPAGGRTEKPMLSGISHYLEHMIFKGTKSVRYFDAVFEKAGALTNGMTDVDTTVYVAECLKQNAPKTLKLWLQLLSDASLDCEEFERERGVILSEYFITEDNPDFLVEKNATLHLFTGHPLASTVIGTEDTIKTITHQDMLNYFRQWYHPCHGVVWLSGDLRMDRLIDCVQQQEEWIKHGDASPLSYKAFRPKGPIAIALHRQTKLVQIGLAFSSPTESAEERASLRIFSSLLSSGQSSILHRRLILERELSDRLRIVLSPYHEAGMFLTTFTIHPSKVYDVLKILKDVVRDIRENTIRFKETFEIARNHAEGSFLTNIDSRILERAVQGAWETLRRGHCSWDETLSSLRSLTFEQFMNNVKEIIRPERIALVVAGDVKEEVTKGLQWQT